MAFAKTFSRYRAEQFRSDDGNPKDRCLDILATLAKKFEPYADENRPAQKIVDEKSIRGRIVLRPGVKVDRDLVLIVNEIYKSHDRAANVILAALRDPLLAKHDTVKNRDALSRAGVIAMITE